MVRMMVATTAQPSMDTTGVWANRICGTTAVTVGAPGSTSNGFVVKITFPSRPKNPASRWR